MQYLMLIYKDEAKLQAASAEERAAHGQGYGELNAVLGQEGGVGRGTATWPANITTVRLRDGKTETSDGPYVETGDRVGGFFLIEAEDLKAAVEIAERVPDAKYGGVEIRPIQQ
ncbi:YciI family protein [Pelagibacterium sp. H642]|uniref:YciI family protein n=1 Tax=Pelagibacterium sp. H642 TaxID=1881069 RepID=UPI00281601CC|nr:YciI family protein [Pelagibacterium sp. H642]WMT92738.1 YciI family protein [Pelagibacterium sp. H642]